MKSNRESNRVRLNAYVVSDVKNYIDKQCELYGISQGALISIVMMQHKKQNEALETMRVMSNKLDLDTVKNS